MSRIKLKDLNKTRIGAKYHKNLPRVRHILDVLINLRMTLPTGRSRSVDKEYIFSRTGAYNIEREIFEDVLNLLVREEFYRQAQDGTYYVL